MLWARSDDWNTNKFVFKLDLYLFCLLVYLKHSGDVLRKNYKCQSCIHPRISKPEEIPPFDVRRHLVPNIHGIVIYIYIYLILYSARRWFYCRNVSLMVNYKVAYRFDLYLFYLLVKENMYAFFWVIPRRLNFICQRFGTLCPVFIGR